MANTPGKQTYSTVPSGQPDYSTLEVDESANLPEVKPMADKNQLPEAIDTTDKEAVVPAAAPAAAPVYENAGPKPERRKILGLRPAFFWVIVIAIIVGVSVGAGVGATRNKRSSSSSSSSSASTSSGKGIASYSRLASSNYTDDAGVPHSQLYYQNHAQQIWTADWDSDANTWSFAQVLAQNNDSAIVPKNATPIAASNYWTEAGDNTTDLRCLFLDEDNYVRFLWAPNRTGMDGGWQVSAAQDRTEQASANSSLAEYVPGCNVTQGCNSADFTLYEGTAENLMLYYPFGNGDGAQTGKLAASGLSAQAGTALAVVPIPKVEARKVSYPRVAMYLVDADGYLAEAYGGYDLSWTNNDLGASISVTVDDGAQIAALSEYRLDDYNLQILMSRTDGGVKMAYMNGDAWSSMNSVSGMEDVVALSPIAANQLGRVYAFENSDNGTQLVEWSRVSGTIPKFERVGVVDTTAAEDS